MDKKIWSHLYELGFALRDQKPWERFTDNILISFLLQDGQQVYCSIFGYLRELYGINVYFGEEGLESIKHILNSWMVGRDGSSAIKAQTGLSMFLGDRDEVGEAQYQIIRDLGLKFRGSGNWMYFEAYQKHYLPCCPSNEEAERLSEVFTQLLRALPLLPKQIIRDDHQEPQILLVQFTEDRGSVETMPVPGEPYPVDEIASIPADQEFAWKKASRKKSRRILEGASIIWIWLSRTIGEFRFMQDVPCWRIMKVGLFWRRATSRI